MVLVGARTQLAHGILADGKTGAWGVSVFLTDLVVTHDHNGKWVLSSPLAYRSDVAGQVIVVPFGFSTDFASVPRIPLAYLLFGGVVTEPAVIHDYLYTTGEISRRLADSVFLEAMEAIGIPAWRRWPMWAAVRLAGGVFYRKSGG